VRLAIDGDDAIGGEEGGAVVAQSIRIAFKHTQDDVHSVLAAGVRQGGGSRAGDGLRHNIGLLPSECISSQGTFREDGQLASLPGRLLHPAEDRPEALLRTKENRCELHDGKTEHAALRMILDVNPGVD
jgi:hypothetical protein